MTSLADWVISAYAEGKGREAILARMVLELRQELEQSREIAILAGKTNRRLMEATLEMQERDAQVVASLREMAKAARSEAERVRE